MQVAKTAFPGIANLFSLIIPTSGLSPDEASGPSRYPRCQASWSLLSPGASYASRARGCYTEIVGCRSNVQIEETFRGRDPHSRTPRSEAPERIKEALGVEAVVQRQLGYACGRPPPSPLPRRSAPWTWAPSGPSVRPPGSCASSTWRRFSG
jgi:hypothetical protein